MTLTADHNDYNFGKQYFPLALLVVSILTVYLGRVVGVVGGFKH